MENERILYQLASPDFSGNERKYLNDALDSGWISSRGAYIERFENEFSRYIGSRYGIATSNGTSALHLAVMALGIGEGDNVVVPNLTFAASANSVLYTGARVKLIDVKISDFTLDTSLLERAIDKNTKAIMPVHLYGYPSDMDEILKIAKEHNLFVIEDCAESLGAEYRGRKVGAIGDISIFSFYGNKIITTGEGGMVLTNEENINERVRMLRDHGMDKIIRYYHREIGYNYRMTNMQAAIGVAQLERIDTLIHRKDEIASFYKRYLNQVQEIELPQYIQNKRNVFWLYFVRIPHKKRPLLIERLKYFGIDTRRFFYPLIEMPPYKDCEYITDKDISHNLSLEGLNLPSGYNLVQENVEHISQKIVSELEGITI